MNIFLYVNFFMTDIRNSTLTLGKYPRFLTWSSMALPRIFSMKYGTNFTWSSLHEIEGEETDSDPGNYFQNVLR